MVNARIMKLRRQNDILTKFIAQKEKNQVQYEITINNLSSDLQKLIKIVNIRNLERKEMLQKIEIFTGVEEEVIRLKTLLQIQPQKHSLEIEKLN